MENDKITHIYGLYLKKGIYQFKFIVNQNDWVLEIKYPNNCLNNYIDVVNDNQFVKIYTTIKNDIVYISGSWDDWKTKSLMINYLTNIQDFCEKEKIFIGLDTIKKKNSEQVKEFRTYAKYKDYHLFHNTHYDWWTFPIEKKSKFGFGYSIDLIDAKILKQDKIYMDNYLEGVKLLALAWGWDIENQKLFEKRQSTQKWSFWPIRLYKATRSLEMLKHCGYPSEIDSTINLYFDSLKIYGKLVINKYGEFKWPDYDINSIFFK